MNNEHPVSICIPTYIRTESRLAILKQTVLSALAQNYGQFEVVVCDNASPIPAHGINVAAPNLRIVREEQHIPMTPNFNRALGHAEYTLLKPLCDDDLLHPDFLKLTAHHATDECVVIALITHDEATLGNVISNDSRIWRPGFKVRALKVDPVAPSATIFSKATFESLGGYDPEQYHFDYDFGARAALLNKIVFVDRILCYFRRWPESSSTNNQNIFIHNLELAATLKKIFEGKSPSRQFRVHALKKAAMGTLALIKRPSRMFDAQIGVTFLSSTAALLDFASRHTTKSNSANRE